MQKKSLSINLLQKQSLFVDKFIDWATTVGRLLVIITEIIALSAFIYRFSLDRQIIDLNSSIKQEDSIVKLLKNNENTYRNLQDRLSLISNALQTGNNKISSFEDIARFTPPEITISNLTINENRINLTIFAQNTSSLGIFTDSLKNYPKIGKLNLDDIQINRLNGLKVNFTGEFR